MKTVYRLAVIAAVMLAAACGASSKEEKSDLTEKRVQLQKLKDQQTQIATDIKKLEEELAKLDPKSVEVKPKLVSVTPLTIQSFSHYIDLQGKVEAENIAMVSPRGPGGQVQAVYVKDGDRVRKGQLLIKLDDAVARQLVEQTKVQLEFAKSVYERRKNLWEQNIGTEVEVLKAKTDMETLQRQLDLAKEQLSMTNVYAEISGVAESVNIKAGEFFTPQSNGKQGIRIVNASNLKVTVDVPENYLSRVKKGAAVIIDIPDVNRTLNSTITVVSPLINPDSRGFIAEAKIPANANLKPNQVATVRIQDYTVANTIVIPVNTLQTDEQGKYVYVAAEEKGKKIARKRQVQVGELYGDKIEVKQGLSAGEQLVTQGYQSLYEGQPLVTQ